MPSGVGRALLVEIGQEGDEEADRRQDGLWELVAHRPGSYRRLASFQAPAAAILVHMPKKGPRTGARGQRGENR
jgi:hypothetical protein